jgi:hypothetical protein
VNASCSAISHSGSQAARKSQIRTVIRNILFERQNIQTPAFQNIASKREEEWKSLFFDLDRSLTTKQRQHLLIEIDSWLKDLRRISE